MKIIASLVLYRHSQADIEKTLESLFSEESIDKICIVDNGGHCSWLDGLSHPKIEVIKLAVNRGFGSGHNAVFQKFNQDCDYILVCNPDISFSTGQVDKLYSFSMQRQTGLSIPKVVYPDGSLQHGCKLLPKPWQLFVRRFGSSLADKMNQDYELRHADYSCSFFAPSLSGCFMLISRQALQKTGGFDERFFLYLEDVDLSRRVCTSALPVEYCPGSIVVHESQRRSYRDVKFLMYHVFSAVRYFNKWGWFLDTDRDALNTRCLSELPQARNV
ncbi:glycosyltransferase [Pantoea cypripedii]|uniref:Glycosyltransferase family 2 protein n=1 Tax=Pantoea cypripedii TaxID=55209 RepID=A0A6B9FZS1_PANCY|nr:glycosyltransferase family 2 protein [Pantoea cypripedii]QGY29832.1 glycosyltransferase family 2 protein [Pantoea cypripedii]